MTTLTNLQITNTEYDLDTGFFWIEFENGKSLQCCLVMGKKDNYVKQINSKDNGSDWGLSGDNNQWALADQDDADWSEVDALLHKEARKLGIKII